jgi:hypothetical protein
MAKNFKRRITLLPDSYYKIENSLKKFTETTLIEKADNDTFNKLNINKDISTPKKEKTLNSSILNTPSIKKSRQRKISIYSPLCFNENSVINDNSIFSEDKTHNNDSTEKKVTKFNCPLSLDQEIYIQNFNGTFSMNKIKKINKPKNKFGNIIVFNDENDKKYLFPLFDDRQIYDKNNDINHDNNQMISLIKYNEDNSDNEQIKKENNIYLSQLKEAFKCYSDNHYCVQKN